jgi:hypothetical protein
MAAPSVVLSPTSGPAGTVVKVTVVRDTPPTPVTVTATTPVGSGTATFSVVEALTVVCSPTRTLTKVSDDGTTWTGTFVS